MSAISPGTCAEPGPYAAHCTDDPGHRYSCYDAGEDVAWNDGMDYLAPHSCDDPACTYKPPGTTISDREAGR